MNDENMSIMCDKIDNEDICRFIPKQDSKESVHTVHFVHEANMKCCSDTENTMYRMELVCGGEGYLRLNGLTFKIVKGDIFFLFPNVPYVIEAVTDDFKYMYISYMGVRAGVIMDRIKISGKNFLFHGFERLIPAWQIGLSVDNSVSDLSSEGILLLTFSAICNDFLEVDDKERKLKSTVAHIKKYIDDNFSDPELSLEKIGVDLFYNKKYVSHVFKNEMKLGFSDYLNTVRIQRACTLMEQGMTSVKDIAAMCGFRDALYFSKIFKKKMAKSPKEHISSL